MTGLLDFIMEVFVQHCSSTMPLSLLATLYVSLLHDPRHHCMCRLGIVMSGPAPQDG